MTDLALSPAVAGNTLLWTRQGAVAIQALVNQPVEAWDGERFVEVTPRLLGDSQTLQLLTFRTEAGSRVRILVDDAHGFRLGEGEDAVRVNAADLPLAAGLGPVATPEGAIRYLLEGRDILEEAQAVYGFDQNRAAITFNGLPSA